MTRLGPARLGPALSSLAFHRCRATDGIPMQLWEAVQKLSVTNRDPSTEHSARFRDSDSESLYIKIAEYRESMNTC